MTPWWVALRRWLAGRSKPPEPRTPLEHLLHDPGHLFVTGRAGTGKSTLLREYRDRAATVGQSVAVVAPTGLAAMNVGGMTIHKFFRFPAKPINSEDIRVSRHQKLYRALDAIIIDEVSMVRADLLDGIDMFMRKNGRHPHLPFGGCRIRFFGDLQQLPPVVVTQEERKMFTTRYKSEWYFEATALKAGSLGVITLRKVFRQEDPLFLAMLDRLRHGTLRPTDTEVMRSRVTPDADVPNDALRLTPTNDAAFEINHGRLRNLRGSERLYDATIEGEVPPEEQRPADSSLPLTVGARVMFVKNDPDLRWVNGTVGTIAALADDHVKVQVGGFTWPVTRVTWETLAYEYDERSHRVQTRVIGRFTQVPLRLAWALTIHKAQGMTLDKVMVCLGRGTFAPGQAYVALSRCRGWDGLYLDRPVADGDLKVSPRVRAFNAALDAARQAVEGDGAYDYVSMRVPE